MGLRLTLARPSYPERPPTVDIITGRDRVATPHRKRSVTTVSPFAGIIAAHQPLWVHLVTAEAARDACRGRFRRQLAPSVRSYEKRHRPQQEDASERKRPRRALHSLRRRLCALSRPGRLTAQQRSTGGRDVMSKPPGYVAPTPLPKKRGGWDPRRGILHAPDESSSSAPRHLPLNQSAFPRGQGCDAGESAKLGRPTPRTRGKAITAANQENQERNG
ncbi:hypothetical protein CPLU01_06428 [Colletotrichum plurivorum]|uniref:Uncharacterized protein n=1 Tax=Colletotrichum plurivorum TaxID=2175906 RepID=A0A8H6KJQ1_9PEZI|nr:hypothetical protein CPLU01_06428 [Colletotrichum plurivorum]